MNKLFDNWEYFQKELYSLPKEEQQGYRRHFNELVEHFNGGDHLFFDEPIDLKQYFDCLEEERRGLFEDEIFELIFNKECWGDVSYKNSDLL